MLRLSTEGSDFDTILAAYTATDPNNFATFVSQACDNNSGTNGKTSIINFSVTGGTTYYIVVDGVNGAKGTVVLSNSLAIAPVITAQPTGTPGSWLGQGLVCGCLWSGYCAGGLQPLDHAVLA